MLCFPRSVLRRRICSAMGGRRAPRSWVGVHMFLRALGLLAISGNVAEVCEDIV